MRPSTDSRCDQPSPAWLPAPRAGQPGRPIAAAPRLTPAPAENAPPWDASREAGSRWPPIEMIAPPGYGLAQTSVQRETGTPFHLVVQALDLRHQQRWLIGAAARPQPHADRWPQCSCICGDFSRPVPPRCSVFRIRCSPDLPRRCAAAARKPPPNPLHGQERPHLTARQRNASASLLTQQGIEWPDGTKRCGYSA